MTCAYCELTDQRWKNCRCGGKVVRCTHPDRQYPNVPPLDHAGIHSERVIRNGEIVTEYMRVNSRFCTARTCRNYTETE